MYAMYVAFLSEVSLVKHDHLTLKYVNWSCRLHVLHGKLHLSNVKIKKTL